MCSEGRAHLHEDDAPTGPRIRHRQPVPKVPSLPSYLCICCCMYAVRLHSAERALLPRYVCVCVCFPVARDKLVPAPATTTSGHHHTCNSGLQNPFSQLLLMRYGNEIVQYTTAYSRGNSSLFGTYDGFAEALLCCVVLCCVVFGLLQREINTHLVSTCVNWRRMMISIGGT